MIYIVEDDEGIRDMMAYTLNSTGFQATGFPDGESFFAALAEKLPELVMLDVMLPGMDGLTILKKLRNRRDTADIPVIMATARGTEYDKISGLDLGADDYLTKPFGMMEMVSRVRAVLRRSSRGGESAVLSLGGIALDGDSRTVTANGERVELTYKEFEILKLLLENPGRAFTRDSLLERVWGYDFDGETRTVDVHFRTLRQKLGPCGGCIKTVRGVGYRLEAQP